MIPAGWKLRGAGPRRGPESLDELGLPGLSVAAAAPMPPPAVLGSLDLRVYAPIPEVVIVRVGGAINRRTAPVLAERVGKQLTRAHHVVVDLGEVTVLDPPGLAVLLTLYDRATARGTEIHIVRAEHDGVRGALRITGLDQLFTVDPTADAVIAKLRAAAVLTRIGADQADLDGPSGKGGSWSPPTGDDHGAG